MHFKVFAFICILCGSAFAQETLPPLVSPFLPSPELRDQFTIPNTHVVSLDVNGAPKILRGMEPRDKIQEFVANGITDVLIFKSRSSTSAPGEDSSDQQMEISEELGIRTKMIPMPWKDIYKPETACRYTLRGLRYMKEVEDSKSRRMFVHCTVGEDRTGLLIGLYRMLKDNWSSHKAFHEEMCRWGYGRGNPNKPFKRVVCEVRDALTPLYLRLARDIESGKLNWQNLSDPKTENFVCRKLWVKKDIGSFACPISTEELDPSQIAEPQPEEEC